MEEYFLGIDPALGNTAGVLINNRGDIRHYFNSKYRDTKSKPKSDGYEIKRLIEIGHFVRAELSQVLSGTYKLSVCYENYSFESTNRSFSLGELGGVLKTTLFEFTGDVNLVEPKRLKKFATWKGNASKDSMMAQALLEAPYLAIIPKKEFTDDVADAYFLAKYAWYMSNPESAIANESFTDYLRRRIEVCQKTVRQNKAKQR